MDNLLYKYLINNDNRHCEEMQSIDVAISKPSPFGGRVWVGDFISNIGFLVVPHLTSPKGGGT